MISASGSLGFDAKARRIQFLEIDEAKRFLAELPAHTQALVRFLLTTGLRRREAFNLTWDKVRPAAVLVTVKGGYEREVALSPEAAEIIAEQPRESRYVFDTTNWRKEFEGARKRAGVPEIRWHDLRHTLATWLGRSGASLEVIRDHLGHSSISVTQKYRHVVSSEVRDSLQRLPTLRPSRSNVAPIRKR